jgi:hypothetical protein
MNIPARIENGFLLAYITDDRVKIRTLQRLREHHNRAVRDYETSRITRDDLHTTELGILKTIRNLFQSHTKAS